MTRLTAMALSLMVPVGWLTLASGAWGQVALLPSNGAQEDRVIAPPVREFGVEDVSLLNIGPCDLLIVGNDHAAPYFNQDCSVVYSGDPGHIALGAQVHLPAGVLITEVTIDYLDSDPSENPYFQLHRASSTGEVSYLFFGSAPDFSGGNTRLTIPVTPPETVDNQTYTYVFLMDIRTTGQRFYRAAVKYRRQVSPAPAIATFGDVPIGHPQHQYIEALVASGITAGCGNGNYCPDAPLTRGQMAVFLSKGLGLHFAP